MKTILLLCGPIILFGCIEAPESKAVEVLSDDEMKARVEAEEISFEVSATKQLDSAATKSIEAKNTSPHTGRTLEPGCLDTIEPPRPPTWIPKESSEMENDDVVDFPDVAAEFLGGLLEMKKFIQENIRYPNPDLCVQGRVYVSFVVEKDGCITQIKIMKGISKEWIKKLFVSFVPCPNGFQPKITARLLLQKYDYRSALR